MAIASVKDMVKAAKGEIETIPLEEAKGMLGQENVLFVDIRDPRELDREGRIPGAFHAPRGMLEFWVSPDSPYHKEVFAQEDTKYVFFCAGAARSALAVKMLQDMGMENVAEMAGGFGGWRDAGGAVEKK